MNEQSTNSPIGDAEVMAALLRDAIVPTAIERGRLQELALQAWAWRDPDQALAELVDDSLLGGVAMRDSGDVLRSLAFSFEGRAPFDVELEVESTFAGLTLRGQFIPPVSLTLELVEVRRDDSSAGSGLVRTPITVDEFGGFTATSLRAVIVRLEATHDGVVTSTPWVTL